MAVDLGVKNCRIVTPYEILRACLAVDRGKISAVCSESNLPKVEKMIDARGNHVLPGIIDPHVHYQTAYYSNEELVRSETASAIAGGVTTVGAFWFDRNNPDAPYRDVFGAGIRSVNRNALSDIMFHGLVLNESQVDEIPQAAKQFGVPSFKIYMSYKGEESKLFGVRGLDDGLIIEAMKRTLSIGKLGLCMIHAENVEITDHFRAEAMKKEEKGDLVVWNDARPWYAEEENLRRAIFYSQVTGARTYIVHHSGGKNGSGISVIAKAKAEGSNILAETLPTFLTFTKDDTKRVGVFGKTIPPFRDRVSVKKLWWGIGNGIIDCVGSDHSTIMPRKNRQGKNWWSAPPGFPGSETILPVMLSEGVNKGKIDLHRLVRVCSSNVARCFGIYPKKGVIQVGSDADFVIVDLKKRVKLRLEQLHSAAGYSPYEGWNFTGWPITTILRGEIVMQDGEVLAKPGTGQYISRVH